MQTHPASTTLGVFLRAFSRRSLVDLLAAGLALDVLALAIPIFSQVILDKVVVHNSVSTLHVIAFGILMVAGFEAALTYLYGRQVGHFTDRIDAVMTRQVLDQLLRMPLAYFERFSRGELMSWLREITRVRSVFSSLSLTALIDLGFSGLVLLLMGAYSPAMTLALLVSLPLLALFLFFARPLVRRRHGDANQAAERFQADIAEGVQKMPTIKALGLEQHWGVRWADSHHRLRRAILAAGAMAAVEDAVFRLIQRMVQVTLLWVGAREVLSGQLSFGQLVACYMFSLRVLAPFSRLFQVTLDVQKVQAARARLDALLGHAPEPFGPSGCARPVDASIELRDVCFAYPGAPAAVLPNVTLTIAAGGLAALIGPSGSGKSTLARLIQVHGVPQRGSVLIGGVPTNVLSHEELRQRVHLITQDSALFRGTVRENILAGRQPDERRLREACDVSAVSEFIDEMPHGLQFVLDEGCTCISAGQRQRIVLARTIYAGPSVVILDEATNALDLETESRVMRRLRATLADSTIVLITHRQNLLHMADQLIFVNRGQVRSSQPTSLRSEVIDVSV